MESITRETRATHEMPPGVWLSFNDYNGDSEYLIGPYNSTEEAYWCIPSAEVGAYRYFEARSPSYLYSLEHGGRYPTLEELVDMCKIEILVAS